ncbi:MAG: ABC transporter permease subunit [Terrimicrobiaceae bacterium]
MTLFLHQCRGELVKLFARKRTYIGFGAFLLTEIVILFLLSLERVRAAITRVIEQSGYPANEFLSGLTLALLILLWTVFLLGSLYLALVAGDIVGKEIEDGTMRMILSRPVSRGRILAMKIVAIVVYSLVLSWFISLTALAAGLIHSGVGGLFVFAPMEKVFALHEFGPGLSRYFLASFLLGFALLSIPAIGFFFSCFDMKPAAATIITLSILFLDTILKNIPYFDSLRPFFLTARMTAWVFVFEYRIPWERILEDYVWLAAINSTLIILAWLVFMRRDFKS